VSTWAGGADLGLIFQATPRIYVAMRPELTIARDTVSAGARGSDFRVAMGGSVGLGITF
jgi:hypothetical protein